MSAQWCVYFPETCNFGLIKISSKIKRAVIVRLQLILKVDNSVRSTTQSCMCARTPIITSFRIQRDVKIREDRILAVEITSPKFQKSLFNEMVSFLPSHPMSLSSFGFAFRGNFQSPQVIGCSENSKLQRCSRLIIRLQSLNEQKTE